jgi:hypothetical protein
MPVGAAVESGLNETLPLAGGRHRMTGGGDPLGPKGCKQPAGRSSFDDISSANNGSFPVEIHRPIAVQPPSPSRFSILASLVLFILHPSAFILNI